MIYELQNGGKSNQLNSKRSGRRKREYDKKKGDGEEGSWGKDS